MSVIHQALNLFLHLDTHLAAIIAAYGPLTYGLLFLIVFCETGLVITPFLPGDSLLFAAGAFAARGSLSLPLLLILFCAASILGDASNYAIGAYIGPKIFTDRFHLLKREHLERAHAFYRHYGGRAIVFARFLPILRTVVPFVAGMGRMEYRSFAFFNVVGGLVWAILFTVAGFVFGNIPAVEKNFSIVILGIIVISLLPAVVEVIRSKRRKVQAVTATPDPQP